MYVFLIILGIFVCILLMAAVLIQNPKGGGLSAGFGGGATQVFGAKRSSDFIERATWALAIGLLAIALLSNMFIARDINLVQDDSGLEEEIMSLPGIPTATPFPTGGEDQ